ncbi:MAG: hypothetical protein Q4E46_01200 [Candidatus Saccharibacteria bacterium]|nr:hypothetical protein [Candidatus Saccharibacteria bacterium]
MASYVSKHRRNKRIKACIKVLLCLILLGGAAYAVWYFRIRKDEPKVEEAPTPSEVQTAKNDSDKQTATDVTPTTEPANVENPKDIPQNEGTDPNKSAVITGVLTRADVSGDKAIIRVNIDQYLSGGSCNLTMTSGAKNYTDAVNIADAASTSTCQGFDIPVSKLGKGTWDISIQIISGDKEGTISGKVVI